MQNPRRYGNSPYSVVVVHGGPGAGGEMAPVARELASCWGVLEPIQTETSLAGQIEELRAILENSADLPVTMVGFSWGAWLSFIFAAEYPTFVRKLMLVASGPFEEKYAHRIRQTSMSRLSPEDRTELESLLNVLDNPAAKEKDSAFARLGSLFSKAAAYDPMGEEPDGLDCRADIFQGVWKEAAELRRSGKLLELGRNVRCPVVAIHGDYDPHPAEGVQKPLSGVLTNFRFVLLKNCGHKPWGERQARAEFLRILKEGLR